MKHAAYKKFIDAMVLFAQRSTSVARVLKHGHPVRADQPDAALSEEEKNLKAIFERLPMADRSVLARALLTERQAGLHDFAAFLQEASSKGKMSIKWDGETFGPSPIKTFQDDFIRRLSGGDWEKH